MLRIIIFFFFTVSQLSAFTNITEQERDTGFSKAELEIHRLVNKHRGEQGLPPLILHIELSGLARSHSKDMAERNFYSHVDPQGTGPSERIQRKLANRYYLLGTAENIAYHQSNEIITEHDAGIGQTFMEGWMKSPGHRANILRTGISHIGIGLYSSGNRIFATQKFMAYIAALAEVSDGSRISIEQALVKLELNRQLFEKEDIVVRINLPDPNAQWPASGGRHYLGFGYIQPEWVSDTHFHITLPAQRYGKGVYSIQLGAKSGNATYDQMFSFVVE